MPVAASRASAGSRPPSFAVQTTRAGRASSAEKAFCSSETLVDSALCGRKAAWSLVATSPSFPAYGPRVPPMPSQAISRTRGTRIRAVRPLRAALDIALLGR